jgi:hypothetical protein
MKNKMNLSDTDFDVAARVGDTLGSDPRGSILLEARDAKQAPKTFPDLGSADGYPPVVPDPDLMKLALEICQTPKMLIDRIDPDTAEVTQVWAVNESSGTLLDERVTPGPGTSRVYLLGPGLSEPSRPSHHLTNGLQSSPGDAFGAIVAYLLSPQGAALRRQAREAAYAERKAAYEAALREIGPQVETARSRLRELNSATHEATQTHPKNDPSASSEQAWQALHWEAQTAEQVFWEEQKQYDEALALALQAKELAASGWIPELVLAGLEAKRGEAERSYQAAKTAYERTQAKRMDAKREYDRAQDALRVATAEQEQRDQEEKARCEAEIEQLQAKLKERQDEIAAASPAVILWREVQAVRVKEEAEQVEKLVARLTSQGIRKTLQEARRLGVAGSPLLLNAVAERQAKVSFWIEACRAQAERLAFYPEVLPAHAFALLVRGDSIRVVNSHGRELAVHVPGSEEGTFRTLPGHCSRRWRLSPGPDTFLVKA